MPSISRVFLCLTAAFTFCLLPAQAQPLVVGDRIAICGDSITEQRGYSVMMETYLLACQPAMKLQTHHFGLSGESVGNLARRIDAQVLPFTPSIATTVYGMNDGGYEATQEERLAKFRLGTEQIIARLKAGGVRRIMIGSPGAVDTDTFATWRLAKVSPAIYNDTLANLGKEARAIARRENVEFVDLHGPMLAAMALAKEKYGREFAIAKDGVHPEALGQIVMAYTFLKALGCNGDIATIIYDPAEMKATVSEGHRIVSQSNGLLELESTRYPFIFTGNAGDANGTRTILDLLPFNDDLNRFRFVLKNAGSANYKITWGAASKIFPGSALADGINLAGEFVETPFARAFADVEKAVRQQQDFETPGINNILQNLPGWKNQLPDDQALLDQVRAAVIRRAEKLAALARAAVVPVRHTIRIETVP